MLVISFINLLDTSTTWVDIFWKSLYLAKGTVQECIVFVDNEMYVLIHGDFIILSIVRAPRLNFVLCCKNGASMRT